MSINEFFDTGIGCNQKLNRYPQYDVDMSVYDLCPEVEDYRIIISLLSDMVMTAIKLFSAEQLVVDGDTIGYDVIKGYALKSKDRFLKNKISDISSYRISLHTTDNKVNSYITKILNTLETFYSLLNTTDKWWTSCQECIESYLNVVPNDWEIKACLTKGSI